MANRHKAQKLNVGGAAVAYGNPKVISEAKQKKSGGAVAPAKHAAGGKVAGFKSGGRLDRRARGGGVGADKSPYSSAHFKKGGSVKGK